MKASERMVGRGCGDLMAFFKEESTLDEKKDDERVSWKSIFKAALLEDPFVKFFYSRKLDKKNKIK